ncbi:MAG TPA: zinc-binding dehydrogenase [Ramlibacter sp.]|nr:zinc-binding dehydrogenase [Ramlibacter sp.]
MEPGQVLLVHAAAGGLGQLLCRWASHLGATVIGTVGAPAKQEVARSAGCAHVLLRTEEDVAARCMDLTGGQGVDVVYDSVGRDTVRQSLACLRPGGHAIVCGAASGTVENFSLEWLHARSCKISRPTVETYVRSREQLHTAARAVFDGMRAGVLRLRGIQRFGLHEAADAHRALESRLAILTPVLLP